MSASLVKLMKSVAVSAVEANKPLMLLFGNVVKDYENNGELQIHIEDKLELDEDFFIFGGGISKETLKRGDILTIIRIQGGQRYYILEILERGEN